MDSTTKYIEMDNIASKDVLIPQILDINEILTDLNYESDDLTNNQIYADPEYRVNELDKILSTTSENPRRQELDFPINSTGTVTGSELALPIKNNNTDIVIKNNNTDIVIYNKYTEGEFGTDILKKLPSIVHTKEKTMSMKIASGAGTGGFLLGGLGLCFGIIPGVIGVGVGIGVGASVASVIYYVKEKTTSTKFTAVNFEY